MARCHLNLGCFNVIPSKSGTLKDKLKVRPATERSSHSGWNC